MASVALFSYLYLQLIYTYDIGPYFPIPNICCQRDESYHVSPSGCGPLLCLFLSLETLCLRQTIFTILILLNLVMLRSGNMKIA